jgi:SAM-dependent methyltransferase
LDIETFKRQGGNTEALRDLWEQNASWWQANFVDGLDPEYVEQVIPMVIEKTKNCQRIADIGGGEGQIARALANANRADVVLVDPTWQQVERAASTGVKAVQGEAANLPLASNTFDAAIVVLVLEHVTDLDLAAGELARIIRPTGKVVVMLNHPIIQVPGSGLIDDVELGETYWRLGPYLVEDISIEEVDKGIFLPFVHRPLSRYVGAFLQQGLTLTNIEEPAPCKGFLARSGSDLISAYPRLLSLEFRNRSEP